MKRSVQQMQETYDEIECIFLNACTGEMYDKKISMSKKDKGLNLLLKFCEIHELCIYQTKLFHNDNALDTNQTLEQFEITDHMTFKVIKQQKQIIDACELEWVQHVLTESLWGCYSTNITRQKVQKAILPLG